MSSGLELHSIWRKSKLRHTCNSSGGVLAEDDEAAKDRLELGVREVSWWAAAVGVENSSELSDFLGGGESRTAI